MPFVVKAGVAYTQFGCCICVLALHEFLWHNSVVRYIALEQNPTLKFSQAMRKFMALGVGTLCLGQNGHLPTWCWLLAPEVSLTQIKWAKQHVFRNLYQCCCAALSARCQCCGDGGFDRQSSISGFRITVLWLFPYNGTLGQKHGHIWWRWDFRLIENHTDIKVSSWVHANHQECC
jgi:hypothetical protein